MLDGCTYGYIITKTIYLKINLNYNDYNNTIPKATVIVVHLKSTMGTFIKWAFSSHLVLVTNVLKLNEFFFVNYRTKT